MPVNLDEIRERLWKPCAADIVALMDDLERTRQALADARDEAARWRAFVLNARLPDAKE